MTRPMNRVVERLRRVIGEPGGALRTDGQLLECFVRQRDAAALQLLVQRHARMVWGVCRRLLANHHDAEDAFQATFLVLVRRAAAIVPRHMVGNWLHGVARQTALKARATLARRRAREYQVTAMRDAEAAAPADRWCDLHVALDEELSRLPEKYRCAIVLCDLEGNTCREAAHQLGVPDNTLAARLRRGRDLLAKRLTARGFTSSGSTLAAFALGAPSSPVPAPVLAATINGLAVVAAGQAAFPAIISANVAALADGVVKAMLLNKLKIALLVVLAFAICGTAYRSLSIVDTATGAPRQSSQLRQAQQNPPAGAPSAAPGAAGKSGKPRDDFDAFDMLTPAARLQWLDKHKLDTKWTAAARGDVVATVAARGTLESARSADAVCAVRAFPGPSDFAVIKRVVEDGANVKKGDVVVELDDSALKDALKDQQVKLDFAREAVVKAKGDAEAVKVRQAMVDRLKTQLLEIQQQIKACRMVAPQDGRVVYWVPEQRRDGNPSPIVAQGEPVREGQKLLQVVDLAHMQVRVLLPKPDIDQLRQPGPKNKEAAQPALIRVDAFPNRVLKGHVATVDNVPQQRDFLFDGVRRYRVLLAIDDNDGNLLPGLSAEATIETGRANNAVHVPAADIISRGGKHYCYVRTREGIDKVEVVPGVWSDRAIEIRSGLDQGNRILRDPAVQLRGVRAGGGG
jgi:RNA polymerase sigma factor (sigma-70 family)